MAEFANDAENTHTQRTEFSDQAFTRLRVFAFGVIVAIAVEQGVSHVLQASGVEQESLRQEYVISALIVVLSLCVALAESRRWLKASALVHLGSAYIVFLTFLVSLGDHASVWWADGHQLHGISWACLLIAVFPFVIPGTARRNLVVVIILLGADPLGLYASSRWFGHPLPHAAAYGDVLLPNVIAGFLATGMSFFIHRVHRDLRNAQQLGQYTLKEELGEGGMGIVYRAQHALLRRPAALKVLPSEKAGEISVARFEREVQYTARLTHPNTVQIFDYGHTPEGVFYYVMEYLDGYTLEQVVELHGPLQPGRVIHLLVQVCGALYEAHCAGLVHRDIKPSNLMLCQRGQVHDVAKVLDFGLVKQLDVDRPATDSQSTAAFSVIGTPSYLSPEAVETPEEVDQRSDLYSLGAVAYFLLTGTPVFERSKVVEICYDHLHTEPETPSQRLGDELPADLEAIVLQCLAKQPEDRPEDARELQQALLGCGHAHRWSEKRAAQWWSEHRESMPASQGPPSRSRQTLAIDWRARG